VRIARVELFPLVSERPKFNKREFPIPATQDWWGGDQTLVRIHTDDGISGWGNCGIRGDLAQGSLEALTPLLLGENALDVERVTDKLQQSACWYGRGGVLTAFVGAINIALWDILGQACNQSVSTLLGGRYRDRIRPYASQLFSYPVGPMVRRLTSAREQGFRAFKLGWADFGRIDLATDEAMVKAARKAVGDDCDLMVDAGGSQAYWHGNIKWAADAARMLHEHNVVWFEEALRPDDVEGFKQLRELSPVPIATGECLRRRQAFYPFIYNKAVDVLQPDLTVVGGISEGRRIGWLANDEGILVVLHGWNTAVGLAADLQLTAALEQAKFVEYQTGTTYIDGILASPFALDKDGMLPVPSKPGLGIEVDLALVKKHGPQ